MTTAAQHLENYNDPLRGSYAHRDKIKACLEAAERGEDNARYLYSLAARQITGDDSQSLYRQMEQLLAAAAARKKA